jgi:hypothetical protein
MRRRISSRMVVLGAVAAIILASGTALALTTFPDVPEDATHASGIEWAAERGIVRGFGDGTFRSEDPVSRGQLSSMLQAYDEYAGEAGGTVGPAGPQGPVGPTGPQGPAGPPGDASIPISAAMSFGDDDVVLAEFGSLQVLGRCEQVGGIDEASMVWTGSEAGWFSSASGSTPQAAGAEVVAMTNSTSTGQPYYTQRIDRGHAMSPDGSYLAFQQETTTVALNVFGRDCVFAGLGVALQVDLTEPNG